MSLPERAAVNPQHLLILQETHYALYPLVHYSDCSDTLTHHITYGLLATLWGKPAPDKNLDYWSPGLPQQLLRMNAAGQELFFRQQRLTMTETWGTMEAMMAYHSPLVVVTALLAYSESFAPILRVASRWDEASERYGEHPDGILITTEASGQYSIRAAD